MTEPVLRPIGVSIDDNEGGKAPEGQGYGFENRSTCECNLELTCMSSSSPKTGSPLLLNVVTPYGEAEDKLHPKTPLHYGPE